MYNFDDYGQGKRTDYYDTMQVCLNGHQITTLYDSSPENRKDFCEQCGEKTIYQCQKCGKKIRGHHHMSGVSYSGDAIPSNCNACGNAYPWKTKHATKKTKLATEKTKNNIRSDEVLESIFSKFPDVVTQLRKRYDDRETLDVQDEYDAQDLLHGLLRLYFDDIRSEEWNPSYAGSSTRSDFLLKDEKIIIEVKHTRKGLTKKKLKEELIIDKEQYKQNKHCETLYCFVYDPDKRIDNPRGFEKDISENSKNFVCKIVIVS